MKESHIHTLRGRAGQGIFGDEHDIRSQKFIHTRQPLKTKDAFTFSDNQPLPGESYYYVRIRQVDDQMARSSLIWIQR